MLSRLKRILTKEHNPPTSSEVLRLADVASEYKYLKQVRCRACGSPTSHTRTGSMQKGGKWVGAVMHDFWTITCLSCGAIRQLTLEVPLPDILVVPDRDEVRRRFSGEAYTSGSARQEVIKLALDELEQAGVFHKVFTYPRVLLAVADLTFSEFVSAYIGACYRLAIKKAGSSDRTKVMIPKSIAGVIQNPHSPAHAEQALEFLLNGDE